MQATASPAGHVQSTSRVGHRRAPPQRLVLTALSLSVIAFPAVAVTSQLGVLSPTTANLLRGLTHVTLAIVLGGVCVRANSARCLRRPYGHTLDLTIPAWYALTLMLGLGLWLQPLTSDIIARGAVLWIFLTVLLILFPFAVAQWSRPEAVISTLCRVYVLYAAVLLGLAVAYRGAEGASSVRLGYPFAEGVFGYHLLIAWAICVTVRRNLLLATVFALAAVLSGSRSNLLLLVMGHLALVFHSRRPWTGLLLLIVLAGGFAVLTQMEGMPLRPYFVDREDISAGRLDIWQTALDTMRSTERWWTGVGPGQSVILAVSSRTAGIGTHNSFLDATYAWGMPFAIFAHLFWLWRFWPRDVGHSQAFYHLQLALFLLITCKAFVTDTFWINAADGATLLASFVLLCPKPDPTRSPTARATMHSPVLRRRIMSTGQQLARSDDERSRNS